MFFSKKSIEKKGRFVVVVGTSPLAVFLVYVLQENGFDVTVLKSVKNKEIWQNYTLHNAFQNQSIDVNICENLNKKPECCFIASSFDEYKSDLFFLSDVFLKDVPVVNFSSFYNHKIIEQMENVNEIRAHFKGWLVKSRKELFLLNRVSEIIVCENKNKETFLKELLTDKKIDIKNEKDSDKLFFQELAASFLGNLCLLAYKSDISLIVADNEKRKRVDLAISETAKLLKKEKHQIDEQKVLSDIYAFPDGYTSEFDSKQGIDALSKFVDGIDYFETPNLYELFATACKKY